MQLDDQTFCFFGKQSVIKGNLYLEGPTHISSKIEGNLEIKVEHKLSVEPTGFIHGTLKGGDIDVFGKVEGDIISSGILTIYPSAQVSGHINAKSLIIRPGAIVNMKGHTSD